MPGDSSGYNVHALLYCKHHSGKRGGVRRGCLNLGKQERLQIPGSGCTDKFASWQPIRMRPWCVLFPWVLFCKETWGRLWGGTVLEPGVNSHVPRRQNNLEYTLALQLRQSYQYQPFFSPFKDFVKAPARLGAWCNDLAICLAVIESQVLMWALMLMASAVLDTLLFCSVSAERNNDTPSPPPPPPPHREVMQIH